MIYCPLYYLFHLIFSIVSFRLFPLSTFIKNKISANIFSSVAAQCRMWRVKWYSGLQCMFVGNEDFSTILVFSFHWPKDVKLNELFVNTFKWIIYRLVYTQTYRMCWYVTGVGVSVCVSSRARFLTNTIIRCFHSFDAFAARNSMFNFNTV